MRVLVALLACASIAVDGAAPGHALAPRPRALVAPGLRRARAAPLVLAASEDDGAEAPAAPPAAPAVTKAEQPVAPPAPVQPICNTCDGSGRIEGGWGTLPGLKWVSTTFGLRAYRPCPECARAGRRYVRRGQNLDEIYSGAPRRTPNTPN
ncbi:hypothetical protein KFE25_010231 [Diacronema lutheri]|uniref:Uncharacterized protein n=1 Tax=Diacronema lutheri TaxID=2081491 RepID=A0A8J5XI74_DIALT|nr:hypothetical protein KFE25_010231 [Diacronema lutheri]